MSVHRKALGGFVARVLAGWLGVFSLSSAVAALRHPTFDANLWWIDLGFLGVFGNVVFAVSGALLLGFAVAPPRAGVRRPLTVGVVAALGLVALGNTVAFYVAWSRGRIAPAVPVPLSLLVALLLSGIGLACLWPGAALGAKPRAAAFAAASLAFLVGLPLAEIAFFGTTDYRRKADIIVVLGAKVHANGRPSTSLSDRVMTAVDLYRKHYASTIVVSGGVGESGHDESVVMRDLAVSQGVPASAIVLDHDGVTSSATVANTTRLFQERRARTALVVSQFYHLPRLQLDYQRAGYDVFTVPAASTLPIPMTPYFVLREVPAFWLYYLRGALGSGGDA